MAVTHAIEPANIPHMEAFTSAVLSLAAHAIRCSIVMRGTRCAWQSRQVACAVRGDNCHAPRALYAAALSVCSVSSTMFFRMRKEQCFWTCTFARGPATHHITRHSSRVGVMREGEREDSVSEERERPHREEGAESESEGTEHE